MSKINIEFPDGSKKEYDVGVEGFKVVSDISEGLARNTYAMKLNEDIVDLNKKIESDSKVQFLTWKDKEGQDVFKHSAAHVLAIALMRLFPKAKLTIGPNIDNGFYYDVDVEKPFTPEDLDKINSEAKKVIKENIPFERKEVSKEEALKLFQGNEFKEEMISDLDDGTITIYANVDDSNNFIDLCRGPHVPSTGKIKAFKVMKASGAFWRGDAKNKQLQRIYGVAFPTKDELKNHLHLLEEAEKRDHKKIGKEMGLFSFHEEGPGFPFMKPKGMMMWDELMDYWKEVHKKWNYEIFKTPMMLNRSLWETSGHWENYRENMYTLKIDEQDFAIKPMNCPGGILIYKEDSHSYKDLPLRAGEIGLVHRHEASGALSGMFRVRCFHQDDAHIFMTEEQIKDEILGVLKIADEMYATFGLDYHLELSTKPEKAIGKPEAWEIATAGLKAALDETGREYVINEGDGAFYGPKIDIHIKDALGRTWQCGTIQLDMNLPERFDMTYVDEEGNKKRPVMIHRVIYGSFERFFGIIVEHFAGKFPLWLSPVQVRILPIADRHIEYCKELKQKMFKQGLRLEIDDRSETTGKKVREAQLDKVNYILVIGDQEVENKTINVRTRENEVLGEKQVDEFIKDLQKEVGSKIIK